MDIEFNSQEELYKRVRPALTSKRKELKRYGYEVKEEQIWLFLADTVFSKSSNLTLADIVSSIMHLDSLELVDYIKNSNKKQYLKYNYSKKM